jgi:phosphate transport system permease protein
MATVPLAPGSLEGTPAKQSYLRRLRAGDAITHTVTLLCASSILLVTVLLVVFMWNDSALPRQKFGFGFITSSTWDAVKGQFGALPFAFGTVVTAITALIISVPLGLGAAIFLAELAPRKLSNYMTFLIELLAAVPSVIYGVLGISLVVPVLQSSVVPVLKKTLGFLPIFSGPFYGVSIFSACIVLSVMIVPFIVSVSREVLMAVPTDQREAALALGSTRWETTWKAVLPYARRGIYGSVFLALARALGETMAVTMVIGNSPKIATSLLAPGYTIASVIANEFTEATGDLYLQSLIELGLVLFALTMVINAIAQLLVLSTGARLEK